MAQTESARALFAAIDKFVADSGSDPSQKELVDRLKTVREEVGGDAEPDAKPEPRDTPEDDHSFETAKQRHTARSEANIAAKAGTGTDGADGGEGK